jgi:hypothetical protein
MPTVNPAFKFVLPTDTPTVGKSHLPLNPLHVHLIPLVNGNTIVFEAGTTEGVVQGTVQPGQVVTYMLGGGQYQPMILRLDTQNSDVYLGVIQPNGNKMLDPAKKWIYWQWLLPETGQYTIQVVGDVTAEDYTLTAKIAQQVSFASGSSSITLNGTTINGYTYSYALNCKANQNMTATLNVPSSTAYLDIFGLATGPLLDESAKANTWTGALPETQDYVIEVIPVNGEVVNYSLSVSVH